MGIITIQIAVNKIDRNTGQIEGLPKNPRFIRDEKFELLKKSIQENPEMLGLRELLVYPVGERYVVIGGNMRLEACKALGYNTVPCKVLDADTPVETLRAYTIKDNAGFGEWDWDKLANEWDSAQLTEWGLDVPEWETEEEPQQEAKEDDFDEEKDKVETVCKKGDIWLLGQHRLMCGDSTNAEEVSALIDGQSVSMLLTDPPYGMNLTPNYKSIHKNHQSKATDYEPIIGDQDKFDARFIFDLFSNVQDVFLWGADYFRQSLPNGGSWFVWDKTCGKHEGRIGNEFELCFSKKQHKKEIIRIEWAGFIGMQEEDGKRAHPTQKPVRLSGWFLNKYSKDSDIVLDLFGGSGSTLIACEQLNRKCYMMELDPHYCDVIIARWEKLTGQKATKL